MHLHREKKDVVSKKKDPADKLLHVGLSQTRNKSNMNKEITCLPLPQITDPIIMDPVSMTWRNLQQKIKNNDCNYVQTAQQEYEYIPRQCLPTNIGKFK